MEKNNIVNIQYSQHLLISFDVSFLNSTYVDGNFSDALMPWILNESVFRKQLQIEKETFFTAFLHNNNSVISYE